MIDNDSIYGILYMYMSGKGGEARREPCGENGCHGGQLRLY